MKERSPLASSYLPVERVEDLDAARLLADHHGGLDARDPLELACCTRRKAPAIRTFDRALAAAFARR